MFSEAQIEISIEMLCDKVDSLFMQGQLTKTEYNRAYRKIKIWEADMYSELEKQKTIQAA